MAKHVLMAVLLAAAVFCNGVASAASASENGIDDNGNTLLRRRSAPSRADRRQREERAAASLQKEISAIQRTALKADGTPKIKHIVVAMLENRAFDHMLGWMGQWGVPVDGLKGTETNTIVQHDGTVVEAKVSGDCPYINPFDPMHGLFNTTNEVMNGAKWINPAPMSGFAQAHYLGGFKNPGNVMTGFAPDRVPAISTLAKEFAVFDKYFCSVPGPTFPNRFYWYFHSGTSHGMTVTSNLTMLIPGAPQTSVYDILRANNMTWRNYFEDLPDVLAMRNQRTWEDITQNIRWFKDFAADAAKGDLPDYTWISPRFYAGFGTGEQARDQHPDHDVALGEQLIKELYEGLRNSPLWEDSLLIITYDEHGGFYDHVSPPADNVPNPDGIIGGMGTINEFNFTREGVRVPFIAISPYIKKGQVVSWPKNTPNNNGQFEHSSMFATLKRMYGFPQELTKRTAWAAPFDFILEELSVPRSDCPKTIPAPPPSPHALNGIREASQEVNDLQHELWQMLASVVHDIERAQNGPQSLQHNVRRAEVTAKFDAILPPLNNNDHKGNDQQHRRFGAGGLLGALRAPPKTGSSSPFLHERMLSTRFSSQGQMADVVRQVMEALVPPRRD